MNRVGIGCQSTIHFPLTLVRIFFSSLLFLFLQRVNAFNLKQKMWANTMPHTHTNTQIDDIDADNVGTTLDNNNRWNKLKLWHGNPLHDVLPAILAIYLLLGTHTHKHIFLWPSILQYLERILHLIPTDNYLHSCCGVAGESANGIVSVCFTPLIRAFLFFCSVGYDCAIYLRSKKTREIFCSWFVFWHTAHLDESEAERECEQMCSLFQKKRKNWLRRKQSVENWIP